jgi:prolyl 4-hydroxylase
MVKYCPATCNSCHLKSLETRCKREEMGTQHTFAILPDHFVEIFGRLANSMEGHGQYEKVNVLSRDPWLLTIDDFLFAQEATAIIQNIEAWDRSLVNNKEDGVVSHGRTRSNGWCWQECQAHPYVRNALLKVTRAAAISKSHFEPMQVVHYNIGESYKLHHDLREDSDDPSGQRIFTFQLYLNNVEEGGETYFPLLDIAVKPKKGRAVFWPNVYDHDPNLIDKRTAHEARPVMKGEKFVANVWMHMFDYVVPEKWGCFE